MNNWLTRHHKLPVSFWGLGASRNIILLKENVHIAIHMIFQNDTPIQKLRKMLEADKSVLWPDVYMALSSVLQWFEGEEEYKHYDQHCIDVRRFILQLNKQYG